MDTQTMGECLVCGTETKNRCSSCVKAGIDLFFCSPEHQKLVWPVHRSFCGPGKANPFRWPALSPEQVQAAIAELDRKDYRAAGNETVTPLSTMLTIALGDALGKLTHTTDSQTPAEIDALLEVRMYLHLRLRSESRETAAEDDPVGCLAVVCGCVHVYECQARWMTGFQHRLSVFTALQTYLDTQEDAFRNLPGVITRLFDYLNNVAHKEDPLRAELVSGQLNSLFQAMYGGLATDAINQHLNL
ncbi:hypothetical protein RTG_02000 [Rhodotorula toruloides ATCC 204091]|uniref:MYND-type domain-containing protein n=1 Tax=Rhodotorula toruloides TaxID=5286 RepID=A0A0K3CIV9_RHOTO|nr:hypothetical protein RTG_02000 [Rhodotorula toruloides ATCC 204091]KAK4334075.1 MYND-type domain-containing protein [Rhodotorula toruloides]